MIEVKMLETVDAVVDDLLTTTPLEVRMHLHRSLDLDLPVDDEMEEMQLHLMRMEFGRYVRNVYGLWKNNHTLGKDCLKVDPQVATGTYRLWNAEMNSDDFQKSLEGMLAGEVHPDDASEVIKIQFIKKLREISTKGYEWKNS